MREMFSRKELEELIETLEAEAKQHKATSQKEYGLVGESNDSRAINQEGISRGLKRAADLVEEMMRRKL